MTLGVVEPVLAAGLVVTCEAGLTVFWLALFPGTAVPELTAGLETPVAVLFGGLVAGEVRLPDAGFDGALAVALFATGLFGAVALGAAVDEDPAGLFGSSAGFSGTEGNRSARISDARIVAPTSFASVAFSTIFVITRTSSRRLKSAAGFTRMLRNRSLPGETSRTEPIGRPLGKMRSPPLVMIGSPGFTWLSDMI